MGVAGVSRGSWRPAAEAAFFLAFIPVAAAYIHVVRRPEGVGPLTFTGLIFAVAYAGASAGAPSSSTAGRSSAFIGCRDAPRRLLFALPLLTPPPYETYVMGRLKPPHALAAAFGNFSLAPLLVPAAAAGGIAAIPLAIGLATAVSTAALLAAIYSERTSRARIVERTNCGFREERQRPTTLGNKNTAVCGSAEQLYVAVNEPAHLGAHVLRVDQPAVKRDSLEITRALRVEHE